MPESQEESNTETFNIASITTPEGVVIRRLRTGAGAALAPGDRVSVYYSGSLENGTIFDRNFNFDGFTPILNRDPFAFILGRPGASNSTDGGQVIEGWDYGLQGAHVGDVLEITIPSEQGYPNGVRVDPSNSNSPYIIPPGSTLNFTVIVLGAAPAGASIASLPPLSLASMGVTPESLELSAGVLNNLEVNRTKRVGTEIGDDLASINGQSDLFVGLGGGDTYRFPVGFSDKGSTRDVITDFQGASYRDTESVCKGWLLDLLVDIGETLIAGLMASKGDGLRPWAMGNKSWMTAEGIDKMTGLALSPWRSHSREADTLDLSAIDADITKALDQPFTFIGDDAFSAPGQLRYANGMLQGNVDGPTTGSFTPDFEIELLGSPRLNASSFIL